MKCIFSILTVSLLIIFQFAGAQSIPDLIQKYGEDKGALYRKYKVHESAAFFNRISKFYEEFNGELKSVKFGTLAKSEKADYILLKNQIEKDLYFLKIEEKEFQDVAQVVAFAAPLYTFVQQRGEGKKLNAQQIASTFDEMIAAIEAEKVRAKKSPFASWQNAEKAFHVVDGLRKGLVEANNFYNRYDPMFTWWSERPFRLWTQRGTSYAEFS